MRRLQAENKFPPTAENRLVAVLKKPFMAFDKKVDGALSFFFKHYGKTKFMVAMSKKAQVLGVEKLFNAGPKAFFYFFMFYLIRDTILYILIPIYLAKFSGQ
ncbi:MAG: hypothetical protein ACO20H_01940 [Bacteriovoracaceae bacterium]